MTIEALDVDEAGAAYLPWAQAKLRALKTVLDGCGLESGRKHLVTPDGQGTVYLRTRRGRPLSEKRQVQLERNVNPIPTAFAPDEWADEWYDYIKIETVGGGYIFRPHLGPVPDEAPIGTYLPYVQVKLPYNGGKFTPMDISSYTHFSHVRGNQIETSALVGLTKGALVNVEFVEMPHLSSAGFMTFKHRYVDSETGEALVRVLHMGAHAAIVDSETGVALVADTGYSLPTGYSAQASRDGRHVVVNETKTLESDATAKRISMRIDFGADVQVVTELIDEDTPYGSYHILTAQMGAGVLGDCDINVVTGITGSATFPITRAAGPDETILTATATSDYFKSHVSNRLDSTNAGVMTLHSDYVLQGALSDGGNTVVLQNPGHDVIAAFPLDSIIMAGARNATFDTVATEVLGYSIDESILQRIGTLRVLYSDPAVPFLLYEYDLRELQITNNAGRALNPTTVNGNVGWTSTVITTDSRQVGVLCGDEHRVLFTDAVAPVTAVGEQEAELFSEEGGFPTPGVVAVDTVVPVTTNPYRKWLKHRAPEPDTFTDNRYQLSVKDVNNWVVAVTKLKQFKPGAPVERISTFDLYAKRINEASLRANFIDYLISTMEGDPPPFPTVLADLQAGNFDPYEIRLVQTSLGSVH